MDEFAGAKRFLRPSDQARDLPQRTSRLLEKTWTPRSLLVTILKSVNVSAGVESDTVRIADRANASVVGGRRNVTRFGAFATGDRKKYVIKLQFAAERTPNRNHVARLLRR